MHGRQTPFAPDARRARWRTALAAALAAMALWGWALDLPWLRDLGARLRADAAGGARSRSLLLAAGFLAAERGSRRAARRGAAALVPR